MAELYRHIGPDTDIPAGDIGVGEREVGYLFGAYKNLVGRFDGAMTGKNPAFGGSCVRKEATGYGCAYFLENVFQRCGEDLDGKVCVISGAGKVALYLADMLLKKGVKVVSLSDSKGMVHFLKGLSEDCLTQIIQIKEKEHGALEELCKNFDDCKYYDGERPWSIAKDTDVDIIIPAATQNEIDKSDAEILASNNIRWICEAANMPLTHDAQNIFKKNNVTILPSKAVNAGGVAVSGLERTQNAQYLGWSSEKVNQHLKDIMSDIHDLCAEHGQDQGQVNYSKGANIAGFERVAKAMMAYGTL
jgi:glutamate dehydrogenase (NADP+)